MPNWCQNKLEFSCSNAQMEQIKTKLISTDSDSEQYVNFECLIPFPEELSIGETFSGKKAQALLSVSGYHKLTYSRLKQFVDKKAISRLERLAKRHRWTVAHFIHWLDKHPKEQIKCDLDLSVGRQLLHNLSQYGVTNWYRWRYANWGCKWNASRYGNNVSFTETSAVCYFDTPWNPPEEWFSALCRAFPDVDFVLSYFEPGMWFAGEYIANQDGSFSKIYVDNWAIKAFAKDVFYEEFDEDEQTNLMKMQ